MIVKTRQGAAIVKDDNWKSERLLLQKDNMGFSFHITTIKAHSQTKIHYKNHLESVYCIRGEGSILDLETNQEYQIIPGTIYALDKNDKHILKARTEMEFACVFNPPCAGKEKHDKDGSYSINK
jgi:L-ectoine synthase